MAAPSEAASATRASVARAIARAGSSRTEPPKARKSTSPSAVTAATPSRPGPKKNAGGASMVSPAMQSAPISRTLVIRERPSIHAVSPRSDGRKAVSAM